MMLVVAGGGNDLRHRSTGEKKGGDNGWEIASVRHFRIQRHTQSTRWNLAHFVLACLLGFAWVPCYAQIVTATLSGTVTNVTGATVTVVNTATGIATESATNQARNCIFPVLVPGIYNLLVERNVSRAAPDQHHHQIALDKFRAYRKGVCGWVPRVMDS